MQEIFSSRNTVVRDKDDKTEKETDIDGSIDQLSEISQRKTVWHELIQSYIDHPDMNLEDEDAILR